MDSEDKAMVIIIALVVGLPIIGYILVAIFGR